ncbi:MAG: Vms1/Ankzf1 family peptidyl-tRNA hydrolase [Caldilineaceae bacterium]
MLNHIDIQQLVDYENHECPVVSVYLDVDPRRRSVEQYRLALRNLLDTVEKANAKDIEKIQNYVEMGYNRQGCGLIMFSCEADGFWWAQSVQPPVEDRVFVSFRPYIRPLAVLLDTYDRYGVIHVDQAGARLYLFHMGILEAAEGHLGEAVKTHRAGGWSAPRLQRREAEQARQNLQEAAELAESFYRQAETRRLLLVGTEKNVARFKELLSHRLRAMVVGQFNADANAGAAEIRNEALRLVQSAEETEANALTERIITTAHKGGNALLGLAETLTAVQSGRAQHIVVLADYTQPAYRFVDSGYILLELDEASELASGRVQSLPDAVDSVIRRALGQGIGVTILDEHVGLAAVGKIGALTRY